MNIRLTDFTDRALAHLESAFDVGICSAVRAPIVDPQQIDRLVECHRLAVEERVRRELAAERDRDAERRTMHIINGGMND